MPRTHQRPLGLLVLTLVTIVTAMVTYFLNPRQLPELPDGFSKPVLALELVPSSEWFRKIVNETAIAPAGKLAASLYRGGTIADLFFIAAYGVLWFQLLLRAGGRRRQPVLAIGIGCIIIAAIADYVEDAGILRGLYTGVASATMIRMAGTIKWISLAVVFAALVERFWTERGTTGAPSRWLNRAVAVAYTLAAASIVAGFAAQISFLEMATPVISVALILQLPLFWLARLHAPPVPPDPNFTEQLDDVRVRELLYITQRRKQANTDQLSCEEVANSLVGLSLSGGGIRSATTNLGILQALSSMGILPVVDYLSTVSGGGYIGGCLTALLSIRQHTPPAAPDQYDYRDRNQLRFGTSWGSFPFNPVLPESKGPCCEPQAQDTIGKKIVAHLRTHGNFLIARRGLLKRDALRAVGHLLTGIVYHLLTTITIFFVGALLLMGVAHRLEPEMQTILAPAAPQERTTIADVTPMAGNAAGYLVDKKVDPSLMSEVGAQIERAWDGVVWDLRQGYLARAMLFGAGATLFVFLLFFFVTPPRHKERWPRTWRAGETQDDRFAGIVLNFAAVVLIAAIPIACCSIKPIAADGHMGWIAEPFLVLLGARIASFVLSVVIAKCDDQHARYFELWTREFRSLWGSFQAMTIYGMVMALAFAFLPILAYGVANAAKTTNVSSWGAITPVVSLVFSRLLVTETARAGAARWRIPTGLMHFLLGAAVTIFIGLTLVACAALAVYFQFDCPLGSHATWWVLAIVISGVTLAALSVFGDINRISPHYFYRDRLIETYLRTECPGVGKRMETLTDTSEIRLHELHGNDPANPDQLWNTAPYTLISAAINLAGSRDLTRKDRKSGYFLFSKYFCGSRQTGYRRTEDWRRGETKLSRAITVSGAAVSTAMGSQTFFAEAFVTSVFNLRLGFWMSNPRSNGSDTFRFWPRYMFQEVFGRTNERLPLVNLSDGGHTGDNVGIYPLLERRCQVIIACDAEADPGLSFGSFTEALRHAYVDLGVDIDIDLSMLRPDPATGLSKSHCAVGRIRYPECPDRPNWLVYLKNSLTGDEPAPVTNYRATCPHFPHESTADQFFDDAQFESYRALGVHIAENAFGSWVGQSEVENALAGRRL